MFSIWKPISAQFHITVGWKLMKDVHWKGPGIEPDQTHFTLIWFKICFEKQMNQMGGLKYVSFFWRKCLQQNAYFPKMILDQKRKLLYSHKTVFYSHKTVFYSHKTVYFWMLISLIILILIDHPNDYRQSS